MVLNAIITYIIAQTYAIISAIQLTFEFYFTANHVYDIYYPSLD